MALRLVRLGDGKMTFFREQVNVTYGKGISSSRLAAICDWYEYSRRSLPVMRHSVRTVEQR